MVEAASKVGNSKAPGPDNIPNLALKLAIRTIPELFANVFESCLNEGVFPARWKKQRLVLLPKGKKPPEDPSSYRPLCMLDTAGKILERVISGRLQEAIVRSGDLAELQYGFRKAHSTIDAVNLVKGIAQNAISGSRWKGGNKQYCAIVTLDVRNAFNMARWDCILGELRRRKVPRYLLNIIEDYFHDRILLYKTDDGTKEYGITGGVPQGSVLGPLLWNIMYDGVFRLRIAEEAKVIGFADDIAIVVVAKHKEEIIRICNETIRTIRHWLQSVGLQLAEQKTGSVLITSRKVKETINLEVGEFVITSQPSISYLGVTIDARLNFKEHMRTVAVRAATVNNALSRIMPNTSGARQKRRVLLANVVSSIMLYGAPIWADEAKISYGRKMNSVYRLSALRVICAFRTVSDDAVCVIAGMPPIEILAKERKKVYVARGSDGNTNTIRKLARDTTMVEWQNKWSQSNKGRWTYRLIPQLTTWMNRKHGEVDYYLTQFLTGHGCFREYLFKYKHDDSPYCPTCTGVVENVEHIFFECPRFGDTRQVLTEIVGHRITPENVLNAMLKSEESWIAANEAICRLMKQLRRLERERCGNRSVPIVEV